MLSHFSLRASATRGHALFGKSKQRGIASAGGEDDLGASQMVTMQPLKDFLRYQALVVAARGRALRVLNQMDDG